MYIVQTNDSRRYTQHLYICRVCVWVHLVVVFSLAAQTIDRPCIGIYIYVYICIQYKIYMWQIQTRTGVSWASHQNERQILARMGQWTSEYVFRN